MATIGSFKKTGSNEFNGEIVTLSVQAKNVPIVPETSRSGENSPSHRVYCGRVDYAERVIMRSAIVREVCGRFPAVLLRIIPIVERGDGVRLKPEPPLLYVD